MKPLKCGSPTGERHEVGADYAQSTMVWGRERAALDELLSHYGVWIENYLTAPQPDWVFHKKSEGPSSSLIPYGLFKKVSGHSVYYNTKQEELVAEDIADVTFSPNCKWIYGLNSTVVGRTTTSVDLDWDNPSSVVGFSIPKIGVKCVFLRRGYDPGLGAETQDIFTCIITSVQDSPKLREYIKEVMNSALDREYRINTYDGDSSGNTSINIYGGVLQSWENLVLDDSVLRLVQRDIDSFFARKEWFIKNNIPFRRGYLFHGPPGNGKTSVIKTMLSTLGMNAYKIRLFSENVTDEILEKVFRDAQTSGPNMVILEDLDRAFPKTGETNCRIGLHTLLNCLDGLESQEGVVTVATANEPTALDKAILKRPGRFDRVILFDNPSYNLRNDFFLKKAPHLRGEDLSSAVDATEGFSFAQLQETYIMAGQYAFERNSEEVSITDLHACAAELRGTTNSPTSGGDKFGLKSGSR